MLNKTNYKTRLTQNKSKTHKKCNKQKQEDRRK